MAFQQDYDNHFKVLLIGNSAVGKSSLLLRFSDQIFSEQFLRTIGVDLKFRCFDLQEKFVIMQIWDTAGQERFKTFRTSQYKGAHGIILTYDITDNQSFKDIENWISEVEKHAPENVEKLLVGNKSDLEPKRQVTYEEGKELADRLNIKFIEASAKANQNVEQAFMILSQQIMQKQGKSDDKPKSVTPQPGQLKLAGEKKSGCC